MKIAFLISAHTDLPQLQRLCRKLADYGDCFIHIDRKTNDSYVVQLKDYLHTIQGTFCIVSQRINVCWGGYSQIKATQILLDEAINHSKEKYERIFLLSGLCYPLFSKSQMCDYCAKHANEQYMSAYNISKGSDRRQKERVVLYHYFRDINLPHKSFLRRALIGGTKLILKALGVRKPPFLQVKGKRWDVFYSSQWFGLTGECAEYVLENLKHNSVLIKYFNTAYASDELTVATIVMNSEFGKTCKKINNPDFEKLSSLHYLHYTDHIWTYGEADYDILMNSGKPFVRKLVSGKSENLIEKIDSTHQNEK